jgi:hypothetical protein
MSRLVSLYPHAWRARYEAEFHELIAERAPSLVERFGDRMAGGAFFAAAGLTLVPVWLSVGATLIRRPALPVA